MIGRTYLLESSDIKIICGKVETFQDGFGLRM